MTLGEAAARFERAAARADRRLYAAGLRALRRTQKLLEADLYGAMRQRKLGEALDQAGARPPLEVLVRDWKVRNTPTELVAGETVVGLGVAMDRGGRTKPHALGAGRHPGGPVHARPYVTATRDAARMVLTLELERLNPEIVKAIADEVS